MTSPASDLDCRGLLCPLPVIKLAQEVANAPVGGLVRLVADDVAARTDVAAWCRMKSQELVSRTDDPDGTTSWFVVRRVH